jgi:hypothetical protein
MTERRSKCRSVRFYVLLRTPKGGSRNAGRIDGLPHQPDRSSTIRLTVSVMDAQELRQIRVDSKQKRYSQCDMSDDQAVCRSKMDKESKLGRKV